MPPDPAMNNIMQADSHDVTMTLRRTYGMVISSYENVARKDQLTSDAAVQLGRTVSSRIKELNRESQRKIEDLPEYKNLNLKDIRELGDEPLVHTNHCLDPAMQKHQAEKAPALMASSQARLERACELLDGAQVDTAALMELTRDSQAICQVAKPPFHIESSGATIMRPGTPEMWAAWGLPSENEFSHFGFSE